MPRRNGFRRLHCLVPGIAGLLLLPVPAMAGVVVTLGLAKAEFPVFTGTGGICSTAPGAECVYGTETFAGWGGGGFTSTFSTGAHAFPDGTSITGVYGGAISHDTNNTYGGAYGTQPYPSANGTSTYTLNLQGTGIPGINYFGVWITAMDPSNKLVLYSGGVPVFELVSSDLKAAIAQMPNASAYYGNPDNGLDGGEPFAYVNFYDTNAFIDQVSFTNTGGTNFESSNQAVGYFNPLMVNGSTVDVTTNQVPAPVAEPPSFALVLIGMAGAMVALARRRAGG